MGMEHPWHALSVDRVTRIVKVDPASGLTSEEARRRLAKYGPNRLEEAKGSGPLEIFIKQFKDFMVLVLIAAAVISGMLGEMLDALSIIAIVLLNAGLGFVQEYKAERSLDLLRQLTAPQATVKRNGRPVRIPAAEVAYGDILILKEGDRVSADARLLNAVSLKIDESPLTGESHPVNKDPNWTGEDKTEIADRKNMVYMGTSVVKGRCEAMVVSTGMNTQIGDIATLISDAGDDETPLERRLNQLGKGLVAACILVVGAVCVMGVMRGFGVIPMFLTGVSLAVAAIPEGLPAVVTIALALGVQRMIKRHAIIRKLPAVETLGCATVICSDKTGTLTKNEMTVTKLYVGNRFIDITGVGYEPIGQFIDGGRPITPDSRDLNRLLQVATHCNDAMLFQDTSRERPGRKGGASPWKIVGDPTEGALKVLARKGGLDTHHSKQSVRRVAEIPFDSDRKRMSVVVRDEEGLFSYVKGAPDLIVDRCTKILVNGVAMPLSTKHKVDYKRAAEKMADDALRVLALAYKSVSERELAKGRDGDPDLTAIEKDLILVGLVGMIDSPRPEVAKAIAKARRAGIETVMVTGDHPRTAAAIGSKLGIVSNVVMSGQRLDEMDDDELEKALADVRIFARVSPRHKLRIIRALRRQGHIVAMTGDGINDAPAVKEADIGIAMGQTGTDVTREAADVVLTDDNYASIVAAIEEGRGIYDNVRKFIRYLLACNTGEVLSMFLATFLGMPLPLLPIQILWVNLVTDGVPAIALGVDPPEKDTMERPPRNPKEGVFARGLHLKILLRGVLIGVCTVVVFLLGRVTGPEGHDPVAYARTLALTTLVVSQLVFVFQCRSERRSLHQIRLLENKWLVLAVLLSLGMHLAILYVPAAAPVFKTVPLRAVDWVVVLLFSLWSQLLEMAVVVVRRSLVRHFSYVRV